MNIVSEWGCMLILERHQKIDGLGLQVDFKTCGRLTK